MAASADPVPARPCPPQAATRRRGETLEQAIFQAVLDQLQSVGYARLTMEGVAACAHTGKAALYRRWPRKEDLVVDALDHAMPSLAELPDTGSLREDLLALLRRTAAMANSATGCALRCLLAEVDREHPFARLLHERVFAPRKQAFRAVLERAAERGQVRPGAAGQLVADVGPALVVQRFLADGPPVPDDYVVSVLDEVVLPLLRA
jgi:AcrR family transcriptional regulator